MSPRSPLDLQEGGCTTSDFCSSGPALLGSDRPVSPIGNMCVSAVLFLLVQSIILPLVIIPVFCALAPKANTEFSPLGIRRQGQSERKSVRIPSSIWVAQIRAWEVVITFPLIVADSKNHTFFKANIAHAHRAGHCCPLDSALFQTNLLPCEPSPETGIVFSRGLEFQSVRRVGKWPQSPQ